MTNDMKTKIISDFVFFPRIIHKTVFPPPLHPLHPLPPHIHSSWATDSGWMCDANGVEPSPPSRSHRLCSTTLAARLQTESSEQRGEKHATVCTPTPPHPPTLTPPTPPTGVLASAAGCGQRRRPRHACMELPNHSQPRSARGSTTLRAFSNPSLPPLPRRD